MHAISADAETVSGVLTLENRGALPITVSKPSTDSWIDFDLDPPLNVGAVALSRESKTHFVFWVSGAALTAQNHFQLKVNQQSEEWLVDYYLRIEKRNYAH